MHGGALILHFGCDRASDRASFIASAQEAVSLTGAPCETRLVMPRQRSAIIEDVPRAHVSARARQLLSGLGIASAAQIESERGAIASIPHEWRALALVTGFARRLKGGTPSAPGPDECGAPDWMQPDLAGLEDLASRAVDDLPGVVIALAGRSEDAELLANLPVLDRRLRRLSLIIAPRNDLASSDDSRGAIWRAGLDAAYDAAPAWVAEELPVADLAKLVEARLKPGQS